jgi:amidase
MVSLVYLLRAAAAFAPLVSGHYRHSKHNATLPSLAEATTEELAAGLEAKLFTSVDLVNVSQAGMSMHKGG